MKSILPELERQIQVTRDQQDVRRIGLQKLLGLTHEPRVVKDAHGFARVTQGEVLPLKFPAFTSFEEAWTHFTGETGMHDLTRIQAIVNGASFYNVLEDALNRKLIQDYRIDYRWNEIAQANSAANFHALKRVRGKFVEDLATFGEDEPYSEAVVHGDEEVSYGGVVTKGALLTITRRAFMNNDIAGIERLLDQLRRAAERTLARHCWAKIINNDNYLIDNVPMFDNAHGNLGSAVLSVPSLTAARLAMFAQRESGSDEPLGLGSGNLLLVVPPELESAAIAINNCESGSYEGNPWLRRFGMSNERIFTNPFFTEHADWALFDVSGAASILEVSFLMGNQIPQLSGATNDAEGAGLAQDRIVYRLRHEYEVGILDFRGAYKAEVA